MAIIHTDQENSEPPTMVVACALQKETRALRDQLGKDIKYITTGLGTDRTSQRLDDYLHASNTSLVIFTGMAGQLDPEIQYGEFVFPRAWALESGRSFTVRSDLVEGLLERGWQIHGTGLTVRAPVVRRAKRLRLFQETGARICDMESAAAMMVCCSHEVDCLSPKIVSDTADSGMLAFYRHFDQNIQTLGDRLRNLIDDLT